MCIHYLSPQVFYPLFTSLFALIYFVRVHSLFSYNISYNPYVNNIHIYISNLNILSYFPNLYLKFIILQTLNELLINHLTR